MPEHSVGLYLTIAAVTAVSCFDTVSAQETRTSTATTTSSTAADASGALEEVVVTAERRTETVQKSSLAIQVLGGEELERAGVVEAQGLNMLVPGLQIAQGANMAQTFIRGVGDFTATGLGQTAVAYNIDGVYIADQAAVQPLFYDVARIEVLKGPQGTLYGRNSSAGAINIITNHPGPTFDAGVSVEFGNYNLSHTGGYVNLPLASWASTRFAFNVLNRDGYMSDGTEDDKQRSYRWELALNPTDKLNMLVVADYEYRGGLGPGVVLVPQQPGTDKFTGAVNEINTQALLANTTVPPQFVYTPGAGLPPQGTTGNLSDSFRENTQRNISAEINYQTPVGTLSLLSAYRTAREDLGSYQPGLPDIDIEEPTQQSYELRFAHEDTRWQAVGGLYYFDQKIEASNIAWIAALPGLVIDMRNSLRTKGYAAFGQGSVTLAQGLRFIAGARWTEDDKSIRGDRIYGGTPDHPTYANQETFSKVTYRAGLEYDVAPASMLYATVSEGFKSGGFNTFAPTPTQNNTFDPEVLKSYTLGIKNRFFSNKLQVNLEGFYWDLSGSQQTHFGFDPDGKLQFLTYNAASATIYGADLDVQYQPLPSDRLSLTLSLIHSKFDEFVYSIPTPSYAPGSTGCGVSDGTPGNTNIDCTGKPLPRAPEMSGTAGYEHVFSLADHGSLSAKYDVNFASSRYLAIDYVPIEKTGSYFRHNFGLNYSSPDEHFQVGAYINNIGNERVLIGGIQHALAPGFFYSAVDPPRTFGARLKYHF